MPKLLSRHQKIIVVLGPTASGKSELAIKLAKKFNGEIISADSRQIYRNMDIGTGKPSKKELAVVPHHLIDIKNPNENYTVAEYQRDALKAIKKIIKKDQLPILVGGTGLYVKAIVDNLKISKVKPDSQLRQNLELRIGNYGLRTLYDELIKIDPEAAYIVDPNNPRRVIRALEIAIKTKKPFSLQRKAGEPLFDFLEIGINIPKEKLFRRIDKRVDLMIKNGLIEEVVNLVKKYGPKQQSFDAIGYREIIECIKNEKCPYSCDRRNNCKISKNILEEIKNLIKKNTRAYAKRQLTWFLKDKRIHWVKNEKEAKKIIINFLSS